MLTPSIGFCFMPLTVFGSGMSAASSTVGAMSITCWNWLRISPFALMRFGPAHHQRIARAAEVGSDLLGPHEGRVAGHRPAGRHVREGFGAAPFVDVLQHVGHRLRDAVEIGHLVEHADHAALGARAVVADDVDEQRVVQLAQILDRLHEPADLVVGVLGECGEYFHLPREEPLLVGGERVPILDVLRLGRELGVLRERCPAFSAARRFLAVLVPAAVELALVLLDPLLRHVVRRMRRAGGEVHEERLVRRQRLLGSHPVIAWFVMSVVK